MTKKKLRFDFIRFSIEKNIEIKSAKIAKLQIFNYLNREIIPLTFVSMVEESELAHQTRKQN